MGGAVCINGASLWGGIVDPEKHIACVGARLVDNRQREFQMFGDRVTKIGDASVVDKLFKWAFSGKTIKEIAKNTTYTWGLGNVKWSKKMCSGGYLFSLSAKCSGEYCYVCAYADKTPDLKMVELKTNRE